MATINVGGRSVDVPDDLDPTKPAAQQPLRNPSIGAPAPAGPTYTNPKLQTATSPEAAAWQRETAARPGPTAAAPKPPVTDQLRQGAAKYVADRRATAATKPTGFVMGRALPAAGVGVSGYDALQQAADGNYGEAAWSGADAVASAGLMSPVTAPVAGAYLAGSGAVRGVRAANEYISNNRDLGDAIGGTINGVLRRFGGGVDDSAYLQMRAQERMDAAAAAPATTTRGVPAGAAGAAGAAAQAQPQTQPSVTAAPAQPSGGMTGNVTRNGNEYSGTNIGGDITINGFAPGAGLGRGSTISPQNMAAADGLAAQQERASLGRVAAAQQAPLRQFAAPTAVHSGNDWTARQRLRSLEMRANGIHRTGKERRQAQAAYLEALRGDAAAMGSQPTLQAETNRTNASIINTQASADASRYNSDNSLRGTMYSSDNTLRGNIYDADSRSVSAQAKLASDQKKAAADRRDKATERLDKVFSSYATGRDGKVDEGRLASLRNNAQAFIGSAAEAARKRGDTATAAALEEQGLAALADDPALMQRYASSMKADGLARGSWLNQYVGTDNPGGRVITGVEGGKVTFSDGTTAPRAKIEYMDNGILPHRFADWDPFADRTTEFDSMDPKGYLRKAQP